MSFACGCSALEKDEQLLITGYTQRYVKEGPGWMFIPCCHSGQKRKALILTKLAWAITKDTVSGSRAIFLGSQEPGFFFLGPYEEVEERGEAKEMGPTDYLKISNLDGTRKIVKGPGIWVPEDPFDKCEAVLQAIPLSHFEYIKIIDNKTGAIRVVKGEALVYLSPTEEVLDVSGGDLGVKKAVNIDEHTAIWIRNTETGQLNLHTKKELYFPGPRETVERILKKIVLEDHQVVILKDREGRYIFKEGKAIKEGLFHSQVPNKDRMPDDVVLEEDEERSFFLPPYTELVKVRWYRGDDMLHKEVDVTHFDLRPQFMTYEFVTRTCDNVELIVDLTFFWEINDIRRMIHKTDDLPADICNHARSVIIQDVSQVTLEKFMANFNTIIATAVLSKGDTFYEERGAFVHTVEVRSIHCKDAATEGVLQEIIKETTDRLNRLQKQASDNEVRLSKMKGDIEEEKLNGSLLHIRHDHHRAEALMEGEAQADHINAFLKGISTVPFEHQITMWSALRRLDGIKDLAAGNNSMYFTPEGVNLSIETLTAPNAPRKKSSRT